MGEAINLINNIKVEKVILNNDEYNDLELNLIKQLDNKHIPYYKEVLDNLKNSTIYRTDIDGSIIFKIKYKKIKIHTCPP